MWQRQPKWRSSSLKFIRTSLAVLFFLIGGAAHATTIVVLSQAMASTNSGYTGFNAREVFPTTSLNNTYTGNGQLTVKISSQASQSACTLDGMWVGHQIIGGTPTYDFDGNQVQILFSGSASLAMPNGAASTTSDASGTFNYLGSARPLIISMHFSGTTCTSASGTVTINSVNQFLSGATQVSVTAPTGSWTVDNFGPAWIAEVDLIESAVTPPGGPSTAAYSPSYDGFQ